MAAVQERVTKLVVAAVTKGTEQVLATSQELVAVDTGDLKGSGHMTVTLEGQVVTGRVIYDSDHAAYVEFGTGIRGAASPGTGKGIVYSSTWKGMPAQAFLRPALDNNKENTISAFRELGFSV